MFTKNSSLKSRISLFFIVTLAAILLVGNMPAAKAQSPITFTPGTVDVPANVEEALIQALAETTLTLPESDVYAVTDVSELGEWQFISITGLVNVGADLSWNLEDNATWMGLALVHNGNEASIEGTDQFSQMLNEIPDDLLSRQAKDSLDPLVRELSAQSTYIFPWTPGTSMLYGPYGVHDNGFASLVPGWKAVDFMSGYGEPGEAPNNLLAAETGAVSYRCNAGSSGTTAIKINNLFYTHLNSNASIYVGKVYNVGESIGTMKTGSFSDNCGYASQASSVFHVHFGFPDTGTFTIANWTLNISTEQWTNGIETKAPMDWFLAGGKEGTVVYPPTLVSPTEGQTLSNHAVHFTWESPAVENQNGYTFRLSTSVDPDTQPWIVDTGLGNAYTSYDHSFSADGTYYWHMRTWNTDGNVSSWETRQFAIDTYIPPTGSWNASYYDTTDRWDDTANDGNLKCTETLEGTSLNKNYGTSAPCSDMDGDTWIGDYSATIDFAPGTYVFGAAHDDGLRFWVDGQEIRTWSSSGGFEWDCTEVSLDGSTDIRVMLKEDAGDAKVDFQWSTNTSVCITPPDTPTLSSPGDTSFHPYDYDLTFNWNPASGASEYQVEWWGGPYTTMQPCGWSTSTSCHIGNIEPENIYYWHVRARNEDGVSEWSEPWEFEIGEAPCIPPSVPPAPLLLSPAHGSAVSTGMSTLLDWTDINATYCVDHYQIKVYEDGAQFLLENVTASEYTLPLGQLTAGKTYAWYIWAHNEVGYGNFDSASFTAIDPPSNDDFANPIVISPTNTFTLDTRGATPNVDDPPIPKCNLNEGKATVWYTYTPTENGAISLDTKTSNYDTFIAVWTGTRTNLSLVACNDDIDHARGILQSTVAFQVQAGTTYYVEVGEWDQYYGLTSSSLK